MATASHVISSTSLTFPSPQTPSIIPQSPSFLKLHTHTTSSTKLLPHLFTITPSHQPHTTLVSRVSTPASSSTTTTSFYGVCYVVRDDVDTDQILPTLNELNPSNPEEYNKAGSFAKSYPLRFVEENRVKSRYSIIIAGNNFGCGSSCEHATAALTDAGTKAVVAKSYDGVFLKSGKILALESEVRLCDEVKTGDVATIDVEEWILVNQTTGKIYHLKGIC